MEANITSLFSYIKIAILIDFVQAVEDFAVVLNANPSALQDTQ